MEILPVIGPVQTTQKKLALKEMSRHVLKRLQQKMVKMGSPKKQA
jgi:hypothetical protein